MKVDVIFIAYFFNSVLKNLYYVETLNLSGKHMYNMNFLWHVVQISPGIPRTPFLLLKPGHRRSSPFRDRSALEKRFRMHYWIWDDTASISGVYRKGDKCTESGFVNLSIINPLRGFPDILTAGDNSLSNDKGWCVRFGTSKNRAAQNSPLLCGKWGGGKSRLHLLVVVSVGNWLYFERLSNNAHQYNSKNRHPA